jgi:hypothetical protein
MSMEYELMQIVEQEKKQDLFSAGCWQCTSVRKLSSMPATLCSDTAKLKLIARMHSGWYAKSSELFRMERIPRLDWQGQEQT